MAKSKQKSLEGPDKKAHEAAPNSARMFEVVSQWDDSGCNSLHFKNEIVGLLNAEERREWQKIISMPEKAQKRAENLEAFWKKIESKADANFRLRKDYYKKTVEPFQLRYKSYGFYLAWAAYKHLQQAGRWQLFFKPHFPLEMPPAPRALTRGDVVRPQFNPWRTTPEKGEKKAKGAEKKPEENESKPAPEAISPPGIFVSWAEFNKAQNLWEALPEKKTEPQPEEYLVETVPLEAIWAERNQGEIEILPPERGVSSRREGKRKEAARTKNNTEKLFKAIQRAHPKMGEISRALEEKTVPVELLEAIRFYCFAKRFNGLEFAAPCFYSP